MKLGGCEATVLKIIFKVEMLYPSCKYIHRCRLLVYSDFVFNLLLIWRNIDRLIVKYNFINEFCIKINYEC